MKGYLRVAAIVIFLNAPGHLHREKCPGAWRQRSRWFVSESSGEASWRRSNFPGAITSGIVCRHPEVSAHLKQQGN
jgi:hypothetical protein